MDITYTYCAGLDVHKKMVVACCITVGVAGEKQQAIRTFGTMTVDLLALSNWLLTLGVNHVVMESTGEFWKPVYNILEGNFELLVVNAKHIKNVPGRKTNVKDTEWIAALLRGSFSPPQAQRDLRDLTRQRTNLMQDRATVVNRLQKVCEWSNLKLSTVATDITGGSARAMLQAILAGQTEPQTLADLAQGRLRNKHHELDRALNGVVRDHHCFMLAQHLAQIDFLDEQIAWYDDQIAQQMAQGAPDHSPEPPASPPTPTDTPDDATVAPSLPAAAPLTWQEAISLLDTIPGVNQRMAELLLAEIGIDMRCFPSAAHLASWAKFAPGNNGSAGKHYAAATGHGNRWLRTAVVQAAWAAVKVKNS